MRKFRNLIILVAFLPFQIKAQLAFSFSADAGYAGSTVKSAELPIFLASYNGYNGSTMSTPFKMEQSAARGKYVNFAVGIGSSKGKFFLGFGRYLVRTPANEAKFNSGEARGISVELKDASTEMGYRFDAGRLTGGLQMDLILRTVSIYSEYVFPDGSRSLSADHMLNGVYTNFRLQIGLGANLGYKILPHLYVIGKCDYVFQTDKSHPEYHDFQDLQMFRDVDYLPRDMAGYVANSWNSVGNSISNDIHGLRFGIGLQFMISNNEE